MDIYNHQIIVFCGGKCGGSTLTETFVKNGFIALHMHDFACDGFNQVNQIPYKEIKVTDIIENNRKKWKMYIIDSYRTPIERNISAFFQQIEQILPNYEERSIDNLIEYFNKNFFMIENYHPINKIMDHFSVNTFKEFDFKRGYNIIEKDNIVYIKLRFSDINNWNKYLTEIFNKPITLYNHNLTSNKQINSLYIQFKEKYYVPKDYLETELKNDREFNIYMSKEEKTKYIEYWRLRSK